MGLADAPVLAPMGARGAVSPTKPSGFLMCPGRGSWVLEGLRSPWPLLAAVTQRTAVVPSVMSVPPPVPTMGLSPSSAPISRLGARTVSGLLQPHLCQGRRSLPRPPRRFGKGVCFRQLLRCWDVRSCPPHLFLGVLVGISPSLLPRFPCPARHIWGAAVSRLLHEGYCCFF